MEDGVIEIIGFSSLTHLGIALGSNGESMLISYTLC